jgi:hypothetical protein
MNSTYTSTIFQNIHQDNQQDSSSNTSQIHKTNTNPYIKPCVEPHCYVSSSMYHVMTKFNHQKMNINIPINL